MISDTDLLFTYFHPLTFHPLSLESWKMLFWSHAIPLTFAEVYCDNFLPSDFEMIDFSAVFFCIVYNY